MCNEGVRWCKNCVLSYPGIESNRRPPTTAAEFVFKLEPGPVGFLQEIPIAIPISIDGPDKLCSGHNYIFDVIRYAYCPQECRFTGRES